MKILGASFDSPEKNQRFRQKKEFPFDLLCDTTREMGLAYGACDDVGAKHAKRISVVIDPEGRVEKVYSDVNARSHFDEVLRDLGGSPPKKKGWLGFLRRS